MAHSTENFEVPFHSWLDFDSPLIWGLTPVCLTHPKRPTYEWGAAGAPRPARGGDDLSVY